MRILYIHNINQVAATYGEELVRRGHAVSIFEPNLAGSSSPLPLKIALIPTRILSLRHIVSELNAEYYDLVHIHWASFGLLGLVSRVPFIVHCHGDDVRCRLQYPLFRDMLTLFLRRAASVLCITPDLLPIVQSVRPDALFGPTPIDTAHFAPEERIGYEPWTILLFARLDPAKGVDIAMEGIVSFIRRHPDVRVRLIDWGPLKEALRRSYGKRFEFIHPVAPREVPRLIMSADVVVGQFPLGALGLSELQAMSCAKPVICSFRYDHAYPYPPPIYRATSAEEIDGQLEYLFQYPEAGVMLGQRSREWVIENHDYRGLTGRLETLYQSIIMENH